MTPFYALSTEERYEVLSEASDVLGMHPLFIEKDYWVCLVLKMLFSHKGMRPHLCFRGGTSLSKVYNLIERFSEDIDVELSPSYFADMPAEYLPQKGDSSSQVQNKEKKVRPYYRALMKEVLIPHLEKEFAALGVSGITFTADNLEKARDPYILFIHYPSALRETDIGYVSSVVKLELCGRAEAEPNREAYITPYLGRVFESEKENISVRAVLPQRTLWEKAFILHERNLKALQDPASSIPDRLARHYYDLASLMRAGCYDGELFEEVRDMRALKFAYSWVDYSGLTPSSLLIIPPADRLAEWQSDYEKMAPMLQHTPEPFESVLQAIQERWEAVTGE